MQETAFPNQKYTSIETAELERLRSRIAELESNRVVVPEITDERLREMIVNAARRCGEIDFDPEDVSDGDLEILREIRDDLSELFCAIPADRVLGEGMAALRRFAERCAQRDHQPDEHIGSAKCVACEAEDAIRANQGGTAT